MRCGNGRLAYTSYKKIQKLLINTEWATNLHNTYRPSDRVRQKNENCALFWRRIVRDKKLPPFSLICDFGKQNTRGNVSKISVSLTCYRHIGSKSTNHSPLAWRREGQKVTLTSGCDWWISIRSVNNTYDWRKFWKRFRGCFVFQSRISTKTVVIVRVIERDCAILRRTKYFVLTPCQSKHRVLLINHTFSCNINVKSHL